MSLTQALNTALAGLNATQAGLSIISGNVANANTPGYVEQTVDQIEVSAGGDSGSSVDVQGINRSLNSLLQGQLWTETSGGSYADTKAQLYQQLQQVYGTPGSVGAFDTAFNNFTTALQALSTSPSSYSSQTAALAAAQQLTQSLNSMTGGIQALRSQAEQGISDGIAQANQAMQTIAHINQQLSASTPHDATGAALEDQRDQAVTQLAQLMNITVTKNSNDQISVFTSSGLQLVGTQPAKLEFDDRGSLSATSLWNASPGKDGAGTITLVASDGTTTTDLIANRSFQSGQIAAYLEMRDQILPQAQSQIDELAAQMSQSLSDKTTSGTVASAGSQTGFAVDTSGVLPGNSVQVTYTDALSNPHTVTIIRVDDPAALPLPNSATSNPNDQVVGVNFTGGLASVVAQLNAALGSNLQFSNSGSVLTVLNPPSLSHDRQIRLDHHDRDRARRRQYPAGALHRWRQSDQRLDHRGRLAGCRVGGAHHRQQCGSGRTFEPDRLSELAGDADRRSDPPELPAEPADQDRTRLFPGDRDRNRIGSVQRDAGGFHKPDREPAEPGRHRRQQP